MEVEAECDRQLLCHKIKELVDLTVQNNLNQSTTDIEQPETPIESKKTKKGDVSKTTEKSKKGKTDKTEVNDLN